MSDILPHLKVSSRRHNLRSFVSKPVAVEYQKDYHRPIIHLQNGNTGVGSCLGCHDSPCMNFQTSELRMPDELADFPGSPDLSVCPTEAISWKKDFSSPRIILDKCIGCGLCAARCPYGAISLLPSGFAALHSDDPDSLTELSEHINEGIPQIKTIRKGHLGKMDTPSLLNLPACISTLNESASSLFVRNLLIQAGVSCRVRRKGDQNMRIDAVGFIDNGNIAVIEIELSNAVLESPRALLEDVAVLHGRYKVKVSKINPVSIILSLPNNRCEYYQVIEDIIKILGLRCHTITVGSLISIVWHFCKIRTLNGNLFMTSTSGTDLRPGMLEHISESISTMEPYIGALYSAK